MATIQGDISKTWKVGDIRYKDLDGSGRILHLPRLSTIQVNQKVIGNTTPVILSYHAVLPGMDSMCVSFLKVA